MRLLKRSATPAFFIVIVTLAATYAMKVFTPDVIIAVFTVIMTLAAIYAIVEEQKRGRFALGLELLNRLVDKFEDNDKFISARRDCAELFLGRRNHAVGIKEILPFMDTLMNHFQEVGELARRKILDLDLTWSSYGYYLRFYYPLLNKWMPDMRKNDPIMWEDVDWLYKEFSLLDTRSMKDDINKLACFGNASKEEITDMEYFLNGNFSLINKSSVWMTGIKVFLDGEIKESS